MTDTTDHTTTTTRTDPATTMPPPEGEHRMVNEPTRVVRETEPVPVERVVEHAPPVRSVATPVGDRVRWGPVWAGLAVTLSTYLVLQLTLVATGLVNLGGGTSADAWWSAGAALVAFFLGGLTTGATAMWRAPSDGILNGLVMWSIAVLTILVLSAVAGGLTLGALDASGELSQVSVNLDEGTVGGLEGTLGTDNAQEAAGWVLLGLGSALFAVVVGALVGSLRGPRRNDDVTVTR